MRSAFATVCNTSAGSLRDANETNHTPSWKPSMTSEAAWHASLVLPQPPAPVKVSRRVSLSSPNISTISLDRPTNEDSSLGKLLGGDLRCKCGDLKASAPRLSSRRSEPVQRHTLIFRLRFLRVCEPIASNGSAILLSICSLTDREIQMPPGSANCSRRAATFTPSP